MPPRTAMVLKMGFQWFSFSNKVHDRRHNSCAEMVIIDRSDQCYLVRVRLESVQFGIIVDVALLPTFDSVN
jgi:hypothetical protein